MVATRTIHRAHGLTFDYLTFDPTNVYKHGLTYTTLSRVKKKDFFSNLSKCCHGDVSIVNHYMMGCILPKPHTFCDSHVLIYFLNIRSLLLHKNDVFSNYNLKIAHILCFNETHFNTLTSNNTSLNVDTRTHSMISVNGQNGTMIIYDNFTTLSSHETFTSLLAEYIAATFNANTRKAIPIITIYKPSK